MIQLRFEACVAVLLFSLCVAAVADPIRVANFLYRRRIAQRGDLFFTLAYRVIALAGAGFAGYVLADSIWQLARR